MLGIESFDKNVRIDTFRFVFIQTHTEYFYMILYMIIERK